MSKKEVIYTLKSINCLSEISSYISNDSKDMGEIFVDKIMDNIDNLELFSELGIKFENDKYKLLINKNYKVIYKIIKNKIYVLYVTNVKTKKFDDF